MLARNHWVTQLSVLVVSGFLGALSISSITIATPVLMNTFHASAAQVGWVITAFMMVGAISVPASGWVADRFGYKRVFLWALTAYILGASLCGLAWSLPSLVLFRMVQALGAGFMSPIAMAVLFRIVPPERVGVAVGLWGIVGVVGTAVAPSLGGTILQFLGWRAIFLLLKVPVGLAALVAGHLVLVEPRRNKAGTFDRYGFILITLGLATLLAGAAQISAWGWRSPAVWALFLTAVAALTGFVFWELRAPKPMLDLRLFRNRIFTCSALVSGLNSIGLLSAVFFMSIYLQNVLSFGPLQAGMILLPGALTGALLQPLAGWLYDRFGPRFLVLAGLGFLISNNYLLSTLTLTTPALSIIFWMGLRGIGMGLVLTPTTSAGLAAVNPLKSGDASAIFNTITQIFMTVSLTGLTILMSSRVPVYLAVQAGAANPDRLALVSAIGDVFKVVTFITCLSLIPSLFVGKSAKRAVTMNADLVDERSASAK